MQLQLSLFDYRPEYPPASEVIQILPEPTQEPEIKRYISNYQARIFYDVPQYSGSVEKRKRMNQSALESDDPAFIYQNYTGLGGLHGLEFQDFGNFHDYTQAKQDFEGGQFFTPAETARFIVEMLEIEPKKNVADLCCGMGQYFNYLKDCKLYGVELDENACEISKKLYPQAHIECEDIRYMSHIPPQDYIVGNPPFNLVWENGRHELSSSAGKLLSQDLYIHACHSCLKEGGFIVFICPQTWLNDELRGGKVKAFIDEHLVKIFEITLPKNLFVGVGVENFSTKILGYQKKLPEEILEYEVFAAPYQDALKNWRESETYQQFSFNKRRAFMYQAEQKHRYYFQEKAELDEKEYLERKYRKYLYELKRTFTDKVSKAESMKNQIETAEKPEYMDWVEWQEKRPTLDKVLSRMKRWIKGKEPRNLIRLVKTQSKIKLKGYSQNAIRALRQMGIAIEWSLNKLIHAEYWQEEWDSFQHSLAQMKIGPIFYRTKEKHVPIAFLNFSAQKYFQRKHAQVRKLRVNISKLEIPEYTRAKLESMQLGDKKLLPHQVEDIGKAIQKPCALLNWEMGTGKTLSSIAWSKLKTGKTLVVAPSLLIRKTWQEELNGIGETSYRVIESFHDILDGPTESYILISLERLPKYYRHLRKIRFHNLILDESDNIKNGGGCRAKAVSAIARKIPNKLILTGTFTRNNASEAYPQLALLLNNSPAMLCEVPKILEYDRLEKDYVERDNPIYHLPYPAYGGNAVFRKNFSPKKTTVFGASKTNQELYNKSALERLIQTVRLRRRFNEIKPKDVTYDIQQITVPMNASEIKVYNYIFDEFVRIIQKMYEKDHDGKVSKMLVIMRQIVALLQGSSHPWTFPQYDGPEITSKMSKVIEIIRANPGKKVMFGSPWKATAQKYAQVLASEFKVIHLESELSISNRNKLIQEFRQGDSQVLVSTIGVLKAGINLPEANFVITDSYPWNYAQLSQYFFRAIRLNAKNHTQVYCLSAEGSFDTNVFNLMLAKEKVNTFIQDGLEVDTKEVAGNFGVNEDMLACAIKMTQEKTNGKVCSIITWGDSKVSDEVARAEE